MRRRGIENDLSELAIESVRLATRQTWQRAFVLGVVLFLLLAVAIPLGIDWWVHRSSEMMSGRAAARTNYVIERAFLLRFKLPFQILGGIAGIGCMLVALWKAVGEARRK